MHTEAHNTSHEGQAGRQTEKEEGITESSTTNYLQYNQEDDDDAYYYYYY
jgi:hypothetical protein